MRADGCKTDKELLPGRVLCLFGVKKSKVNTTGKEKEHIPCIHSFNLKRQSHADEIGLARCHQGARFFSSRLFW